MCVLGFARHPGIRWARTFLRTEVDYQAAMADARKLHRSPPSPDNWRLDEATSM